MLTRSCGCRCEVEKTLTMAIRLANHKRKANLAERIQALLEWRFPAVDTDPEVDVLASPAVCT